MAPVDRSHFLSSPNLKPLEFVAVEVLECLFGLVAVAIVAVAIILRRAKGRSQGQGQSSSQSNIGAQKRRWLMVTAMFAVLVRFIALIIESRFEEELPVFGMENWSTAKKQWVRDLLALVPAIFSTTALSVVVLFWSQLHYTMAIVPIPLWDFFFVFANVICYLVAGVVAAGTWAMKGYDDLRQLLMLIISGADVMLALASLRYSVSVSSEMHSMKRSRLGPELEHRVQVLSMLCPAALICRPVIFLSWLVGFGDMRSSILDLVTIFFSELVPTVCVMCLLLPFNRVPRNGPGPDVSDSSDSEAPLLKDEPGTPPRIYATSIGPSSTNVTWKQLYPQEHLV
mmetsp:Transcript_35353/g.75352  ORF Transcript_35353/g.75352 Transcript_35353/m.75352 type:complete len:341 (+) Transcript_35353:162-1184(+)|eukprot:CAMPEP_0206439368 /NCGR_PEP_ID=MMETSP0324_2-20121206/12166_1 /ASSEMBLY_ACC=CAM_ASM_000836 /TAXON_ID=2866 /ORGANISM="Crypthecodinium cohnii, Strain Seligo" /LENGTH=340 /DNA_ID=CAMNT_0053906969 /DNA_START=112 /DNA_END=1134 /DNA_ORIENTATION=+